MSEKVIKTRIKFLEKYLQRKDVVEICCNKEGEILLERIDGKWEQIKDKNVTIEALKGLGNILASNSNGEFGTEHPIYAGRLPFYDYRIQLNMFGHVETGVSMAIRVAKAQTVPIENYMNSEEAKKLISFVKEGKTILIIAGTGCGKTTLLNSLLAHIPLDNRIITIEDTRELHIPHFNSSSFIVSKNGTDSAKLGYKEMIDSSLRLRPDRVLLGEITVDNVMPFLNIASSGHRGSISTLHAHTPQEAINKLCANAMMSGVKANKEDIASFARDCIDVFVMVEKKIENGVRKFYAYFELVKG